MSMKIRNEALFAKVESVYNTDSGPVGSDAIAFANINPVPNEGARFADREIVRGSLGKLRPLFGGSLFAISFDVEVKHSGTAAVPPEIGTLLRGCAMSETIVALTSVTYKPISVGHESLTLHYYQDGNQRFRLTGCRGAVTFRGTVGQPVMASFNFIGRLNSSDPSLNATPTPTFDATTPKTFQAANFFSLAASYFPVFSEFTLDLGNEVAASDNANSVDGYSDVEVNARDVKGTIDPNAEPVLVKAFLNEWKNSTQQAMAWQLGTVGGNRIGFTLPLVTWIEPSFGDAGGIRKQSLGWKADEGAPLNDEVTIVFD